MKFSERYKALRLKLGLDPIQMGRQFGFKHPRHRVWEIERGRYDRKGPSNQVLMLCVHLDRNGALPLKADAKAGKLRKNGKEEEKAVS